MDNITINLDAKTRYQYYKDLGYHVPYNEPFDHQKYYAEAYWVYLLDCAVKTILGTMWIAMVYASVGGCYYLYKMSKQQIKYEKLKAKHEQELEMYEDPQLLKEIKFQYKQKLLECDDRMDRYDLRGMHSLWKYGVMLIIVLLTSAFWATLEYMRQSLLHGSVFVGICLIIAIINKYIYQPLAFKFRLKLEIKRLNKLIAEDLNNQKKQN